MQTWPKIRKRKTKVKGTVYSYWVVDLGIVDGKRKFVRKDDQGKPFRNKKHAERYANKKRIERNKLGHDALRLTEADKKDAAKALRVLNNKASLEDAANFYIRHTAPAGGALTVKEMYEYYLQRKITAGLSESHLASLRTRVGKFAKDFGSHQLHDLTTFEIEHWLDSNGFKGANRNNYKNYLSGFFNYAVHSNHLLLNPVDGVLRSRTKSRKQPPRIFSVSEVNTILTTASEYEPEMVPYFAIGIFAGLRPMAELRILDWKNINWNTKEIFVYSTKTDEVRYVDLSDNLVSWLLPYRRNKGSIYYSRKAFNKVIEKSDLEWGIDAMRHTFASFYLAQHNNVNATLLQMGHRGNQTLFAHYRSAVSKRNAEQFWSILPDNKSKVIKFEKAAG
ncbi:MAG: hypothetical protein R6V03_07810 [Kiritimatiellia bacterium]